MSYHSYWAEVFRIAECFKMDGEWARERGHAFDPKDLTMSEIHERVTAIEGAIRDSSWTSNWRAAFRVLSYTDRPGGYEELNSSRLDFDNYRELASEMARDAFHLDVADHIDWLTFRDTDQTCSKPLEAQQ